MTLQIEEAGLKKETDNISKSRLEKIQKELAAHKEKYDHMTAKWKNEKQAIESINKLKEQIEKQRQTLKRQKKNMISIKQQNCPIALFKALKKS